MSTGAPAGWYANGDEWETYWDGEAWTDRHRRKGEVTEPVVESSASIDEPVDPGMEAGDGRDKPLLSFVSHIEGKNARVHVWPDRVEWDRKGVLSTGAKAGMAVMTFGASYLATGVTRKQSTEVIPVKSITSVTTKKGMGMQTKLQVITSGNTIEMRVAHKEAEQVRTVLMQLVAGTHPSQQPATSPAGSGSSAAPQPDVVAQIQQLASLRDAGVLTEEEFAAKKAELLTRI